MWAGNVHQSNTNLEIHRVVGQTVAKVVNPLGTVVTLSAAEEEEEDLSSPTVQQEEDIVEDLASSSSSTTAATPSAVCAQEGKYAEPQEQLEGQSLRNNTSICAEMRPADEPAVIDTVSDEAIVELKEKRQLCAEAAPTKDYYCAFDLDKIGGFRDMPTRPMLCVEKGAVPDCSNIVQLSTSKKSKIVEDEVQKMGYQILDVNNQQQDGKIKGCLSSDDDIEHVTKEELPIQEKCLPNAVLSSDDDLEHIRLSDVPSNHKRSKDKLSPASVKPTESTPETPKVVQQQQKQKKQRHQRSKRQTSNDMVEIVNIDTAIADEVEVKLPEIVELQVQPQKAEIEEVSDMVEIIDIDAEKSSGSFTPQVAPDCKILLPTRPDIFGKKKNKRQRKQKDFSESLEQTENLRFEKISDKEIETVQTQQTVSSWSSMVRRRSTSTPKTEEAPAVVNEVEKVIGENLNEGVDEVEANKENVASENTSEIITVELLPQKDEIEDTQAQAEVEPVEKKSESEQEAPSKEYSDEIVVPMDYMLDKSEVAVIFEADDDVSKQLPAVMIPPKKSNRSKKKKRR